MPLEGVTVFGGNRVGVQLVVNQSRFACGCVADRLLPVVHIQPMLRVPSPASSRSPSPRHSPTSSVFSVGCHGSVRSQGSRAKGHSFNSPRTVYPQYIPPLVIVERILGETMSNLSGIFSGYDRCLRELSHWRSWYDFSHYNYFFYVS